jgi:hypothetical protein
MHRRIVQPEYGLGRKGWGTALNGATHLERPPDGSPVLDRPIARGGICRALGSGALARGQRASRSEVC